MPWRSVVAILTIRLAVLAAPDEHVAFVAVDVRPVNADPLVSSVPETCPELPAHSTL
jgi:hypothetical protein